MERLAYSMAVAYDGRAFAGWQRQPGRVTVQETLAAALSASGLGEVTLAAAARTDAGVSARGQIVTFRLRCRLEGAQMLRALNTILPRSVRVLRFAQVPSSFHARASARQKEYRYSVRIGLGPCARSWSLPDDRSLPRLPARLDLGAARTFLGSLLGRHDRAPYTTRPEKPIATELWVAELLELAPGRLLFRFIGDRFTRHLVRNWVWAATARAAGEPAAFESPRGWRGPRAPGHGLVLWSVGYGPEPLP